MLIEDEEFLKNNLLNSDHPSRRQKEVNVNEIVITRHSKAMHDGIMKVFDLDILRVLQTLYVLPYFLLSFLSLGFLYFFYDALALIWSYKTDCDAKIIYWMLSFFIMCPIAALTGLVMLIKVF